MTSSYSVLKNQLPDCFSRQLNCQIIALPGTGISFYLSDLASRHNFNYINADSQSIGQFNILDLDANKNPKFFSLVDKYFKTKISDNPNPRFAVVINFPSIVNSPSYLSGYFSHHIYQTFYYPILSQPESEDLINRQAPNTTAATRQKIITLASGFAQAIKFLTSNQNLLSQSVETISQSSQLKAIITPTVNAIASTPPSVLNQLNFNPADNSIHQIINYLLSQNTSPKSPDITINHDLTIIENQQPNLHRFTLTEIKIIRSLLQHNTVTRDQIADIKWKSGSFDKYSDQAINTTISRINQSLLHHQIKAIVGLGYQLIAYP